MGMQDDLVYVSLLGVTIIASHYLRKIADPKFKQWASTLTGFVVVALVSGKHMMFPLFTIVINYMVIRCSPKRYSVWISFTFCFAILTLFRASTYFYLDEAPDHTNAIMMMLCLKLIGFSFEISSNEEIKSIPSFIDTLHYSYCHAGLLVGPYFKYQTYLDMINCPYHDSIPYISLLKERMKNLPIYVFLYLVAWFIFPIDYINTDKIVDRTLAYKIFYYFPIFFTFRMRMYLGFILGECTCIMAGVGCYPDDIETRNGQGPRNYKEYCEWKKNTKDFKNIKFNFETVRSVNEMKCEFLMNMRDGMRNWNMCIQYWLAMFVYKQFPVKALKVPITMLASALWHGLKPGYYLCLLNVPLVLLVQDKMDKTFKDRVPSQFKIFYRWINWFLTMGFFSYLSVAFLLLDTPSTLRYWKSTYFVGHLVLLLIYVTSLAFSNSSQKEKKIE